VVCLSRLVCNCASFFFSLLFVSCLPEHFFFSLVFFFFFFFFKPYNVFIYSDEDDIEPQKRETQRHDFWQRIAERSLCVGIDGVGARISFWYIQRIVYDRSCASGAHGLSGSVGSSTGEGEAGDDANDDTGDGTGSDRRSGNDDDVYDSGGTVSALPAIDTHALSSGVGNSARR